MNTENVSRGNQFHWEQKKYSAIIQHSAKNKKQKRHKKQAHCGKQSTQKKNKQTAKHKME